MGVKIADKLEQFNNGDYMLVDASAVEYKQSDGSSISVQQALENGTGGTTASEVSYSNEALSSVLDVKMALDTIVGEINEISGTQLDTVGFSADYKNIILNRKSGLNPYTIPIASIINNTSLTELKDIDSTDIGNGKTIVYNSVTQKHKYVNTTLTDELVKMDSATDAHYLADLIDKSTIVNEDGILKVKMLDGQDVTIAEINHLKGLTMNVMDLVNSFANGGVKVLNTPVATYADLTTLDRSAFIEGISYIVYVLADETHTGAKTTYLCDKTSSTYFGIADSQRNFTTNPIDLANEITGKLDNSHIDIDSLWTLLTINDTYKTLTTKNEVFGTHGAKALYDELVTYIGEKANTSDLSGYFTKTEIESELGTERLGTTSQTVKGAINELFQSVTNNEEDITDLENRITTNETNITDLQDQLDNLNIPENVDLTDINTKLTQLETKQINRTNIANMTSTIAYYKITPKDINSFSKILIVDLFGGCLLITGSTGQGYKSLKVVRLSNGNWNTDSASDNVTNKIDSVYYDDSYIYVKCFDYSRINFEGGFTNVEKIDSVPTEATRLPILDLTQEADLTTHTDNTDIHISSSERTKWNKVDEKANASDIPTKVSELTNDSNYQTAKQVNSAVTTEVAKVDTTLKGSIEELSNNLGELEGKVNNLSHIKFATLRSKTNIDEILNIGTIGVYYQLYDSNSTGTRPTNADKSGIVKTEVWDDDRKYATQEYDEMNTSNRKYMRYFNNGAWSAWQEFATMDKVEELSSNLDELFQSVSDGKTLVANAITDKGVSTSTTATFATMATNISKITTSTYKEETKSYYNTSSSATRLTFTFSANISGVKQITPPSDNNSSYIVPETSTSMFTINGKELILYVNGVGTWKVTALIKQ